MRRSIWMRVLAAVLIISMLAAPISAAARNPKPGYGANCMIGGIISIIRDIIRDIWDDWFDIPGDDDPEPTTPAEPTDPSEPEETDPTQPDETDPTEPGETDPTEPEQDTETVLNLIEGHSNTENGQLLRGVTYSLSQVTSAQQSQAQPQSAKRALRSIKSMALTAVGASVAPTAEGESTKIAGITGTGSSVDTSEPAYNKDVANAFDGDTATFWATVPNGTLADCYLIADLHGEYTITEVRYTKRIFNGSYNCTGNLLNYIIEVSTDGSTWTQVKTGDTEDGTTNIVLDNPVQATHVRLKSTSSYHWQPANANTVMTCAEFEVYGTPAPTEPENNETVTDTVKVFEDFVDGGQYYIQGARAAYFEDEAYASENADLRTWLKVENGAIVAVENQADATLWTVTFNKDGTYELSVEVDGQTVYLAINGTGTENVVFSANRAQLGIENYTPVTDASSQNLVEDDGNLFRISDGDNYLNQSGSRFSNNYGGWTDATCPGNALWFYRVTDDGVKKVVYTEVTSEVGKLVYFPVTMFNYDQDTINGFTDEMDNTDNGVYEGFYFSNGGTEVPAYYTNFPAGQYYIQNIRANENITNSWLQAHADNKIHGVAQADATLWTVTIENDKYYLTCEIDGVTNYMKVGTGAGSDGYTTTKTAVELKSFSGNSNGIQICQNGYYLCQWGGTDVEDYGGYNVNNDGGNGMFFYAVDADRNVSSTPTALSADYVLTSGYERWNRWAYSSNGHVAQNKFYSGLVQDRLNENGEIVFKVNEPGIFTFDKAHPEITDDGKKDIYQYVGMPFVLNNKGYYTFDSDTHGTYFADTDGDGASDPWHGTPNDYFNLYFDHGNTQGWSGIQSEFGDGSYNLWAPYNTNANDTGKGAIDYHFGMRADLPFSMTANGRIKEIDDDSTPITFSFKGDDDVWVFIDGKLVIDLGGIHNRLGATIDFANNTITYSIPESNNSREKKPEAVLGSYNEPDKFPLKENGTIEVKLFNDASGEGVLGMTREEFANDVNHEMSIFYLERGEGTSNCQIEFNLPMLDTLLVTKDATKSWSLEQDEKDGDEGDGTKPLSAAEQAIVDQQMFGFTLYKLEGSCFGEDGDLIEDAQAQFTPVSNVKFVILDKDGNVLDHRFTTDEGRFYLKNGHTAKFMIDMPRDGVSYYLVEDELPKGFLTPDYQYEGMAAYGFDYAGTRLIPGTEETETVKAHVSDAADMGEHELPLDATENNSYFITAKGSVEAIESLHFFCVNYLEHNDGSVEAHANDDIIVIDYGLPVQIDPMANDIIRGEDIVSVDIVHAINGDFNFDTNGDGIIDEADLAGLAPAGDVDGHSGTFEFHDVAYAASQSGTAVVRDTFTYTLNKQLTEVEVVSYLVKATKSVSEYGDTASVYSQAKLYVVPATIMYYEENFSNMVTYTSGGGDIVGEQREEQYVSDYQEPGVVGTIGDSTYGSDAAYLTDSHDSNGTSMKLDTTNGFVRFNYTFTGTGTSIFARTSATTGYIQVLVFEGEQVGERGEQIDTYYRDTYWNSKDYPDDTLYNIPVYTNNDLGYGTYTVLVTVATMGTPGAGPAVDPDGDGKFVNQSQPEFYLDGIRVMQPLNEVILTQPMLDEEGNPAFDEDGEPMLEEVYDEDGNPVYDDLTVKARNAYATDGESNLSVVTLRQKLIDEFTPDYDADKGEQEPDWPFVVLTDTDGSLIKASEYESIGPKEEVYLAPGQKVRFSLKYWDPNGLKLYMGMKAPLATENGAGVIVGDKTFKLLNAADCYYDVSNCYASQLTETDEEGNEYTIITYTFEATDSIVSLTNIKVVGNFEFTIVEENDEVVDGSGTGEE